ncbi:10302_t:CDS:2 [Entrophospora sp. SA101]|nr:10302_t:CDS:2 [Entrophospora sp. SA101]
MPDLIIVDGSKEQVKAVNQALKELGLTTTIIGLAKDEKHQTAKIITSDLKELDFQGQAKIKNFLANCQAEVHRYALNFHRKLHRQSILYNKSPFLRELREIKPPKLKITKECSGCGDKFIFSSSEDYDYCSSCELNGSRYLPGRKTENKCSECGDGSGIIKFPNQPPRACKTCHLAKIALLEQAKSQLPKLEKSLEQITQLKQTLAFTQNTAQNYLQSLQSAQAKITELEEELKTKKIFTEAPEENSTELKTKIQQLEDQILELRLEKIKDFGDYYQKKQELETELELNINEGVNEIHRLENKLIATNKKKLELQQKLSQAQGQNAQLELKLIDNQEPRINYEIYPAQKPVQSASKISQSALKTAYQKLAAIVIIPLTTTPLPDIPFHIPIELAGKKGKILPEQIRSVDKKRVGKLIGSKKILQPITAERDNFQATQPLLEQKITDLETALLNLAKQKIKEAKVQELNNVEKNLNDLARKFNELQAKKAKLERE